MPTANEGLESAAGPPRRRSRRALARCRACVRCRACAPLGGVGGRLRQAHEAPAVDAIAAGVPRHIDERDGAPVVLDAAGRVTAVSRVKADVRFRQGDVFVCTYPKCGTTWMTQICHQLRTGGDEAFGEITEVNRRRTKQENVSVEFEDEQYGTTWGHFLASADLQTDDYGADRLWVVLGSPFPSSSTRTAMVASRARRSCKQCSSIWTGSFTLSGRRNSCIWPSMA